VQKAGSPLIGGSDGTGDGEGDGLGVGVGDGIAVGDGVGLGVGSFGLRRPNACAEEPSSIKVSRIKAEKSFMKIPKPFNGLIGPGI
jgi:hypothetical protein